MKLLTWRSGVRFLLGPLFGFTVLPPLAAPASPRKPTSPCTGRPLQVLVCVATLPCRVDVSSPSWPRFSDIFSGRHPGVPVNCFHVPSWLGHEAVNLEVRGSIPRGAPCLVYRFAPWPHSLRFASPRPCALGALFGCWFVLLRCLAELTFRVRLGPGLAISSRVAILGSP